MRYLSSVLTAVIATVTVQQFGLAQPAAAAELIGLTSNNTLVSFDSERPTNGIPIPVSGVDGSLIGIDFRPANGKLYGLTNTSKIYTIDPTTGMATMVSSLDKPFMGGLRSEADFNPVVDRLRLVAGNGQNFRVNVDTGATIIDKPLTYAAGDRNASKGAGITAGAYTNSVAGTKATRLLNIDSIQDALVLQSPPNDGTLKTIGALNANFGTLAGMDILTGANGGNMAYAVSGSALYTIDLSQGMATMMGTVSVNNQPVSLIDITAKPVVGSSAAVQGR